MSTLMEPYVQRLTSLQHVRLWYLGMQEVIHVVKFSRSIKSDLLKFTLIQFAFKKLCYRTRPKVYQCPCGQNICVIID